MQTPRRTFLKAAAAGTAAISAAHAVNTVPLPPASPALNASPKPARYGPSAIKVSCCAYSLRKYLSGKNPAMTLNDFLTWAVDAGLDAVELTSYYFPRDVKADALHRIKARAFLLGLDVSGTAVGNNFCLPPGDKRKEQLDHVKTWVDNAVLMGAPCIRIFGGNPPKGASTAQGIKWVAETTSEACQYAGDHGIFLAMENHGGVTSDAASLLAIAAEVDSPWFGLNFDSGNFRTADPYADLVQAAPYAINAHIKVSIHPKGGPVQPCDYKRVLAILKEAGYRGYIALEYEAREEPKQASMQEIKKLKALL